MGWRVIRNLLVVAWAALVVFGVYRKWLYRPSVDGGPVLVYEIDVEHPFERGFLPSEVAEQAAATIQARVARLAKVFEVNAAGKRVEVRVPSGVKLDQLKRALVVPARLELKMVDDGSDFMKRLQVVGAEIGQDGWSERYSDTHHTDVYVRAPTLEALKAALANVVVPDDHEFGFERVTSYDEDDSSRWRSYYLHRKAEISNADIADAEVMWDPQGGRPEVQLTFTREGAKRFEDATARSIGRKLAIILDGRISSAPVIETKIGGGRARITMGGFGDPMKLQEEAKDLVAALRAGALPAPIRLVAER